ncbi:DUF3054 domain-containing protein [Pseudarthrobacter sp. J64]|uniref:DUF3054 domain-containing protein n=1 Tax=Pseudarthrobacter sp. J64 TaxID=3116485 RepID=UPI002E7FF140|nr:DUF3054 domain-containing protein [Pseudarthrobacter sp. J64]MEE2569154.1 DUF3054 domain-containing protein [Pseudarthrobacter sp. J64]
MTASPASTANPARPAPVVIAAVVDFILILIFAAVGRDAHARGDVVTGVFLTAWPFLVGLAAGWLAFRVWRRPFGVLAAGVPVWLCSLVAGMVLRLATGQTVVPAFVMVALVSLGILLVGYRGLLALLARLTRRSART